MSEMSLIQEKEVAELKERKAEAVKKLVDAQKIT
jgi:hypothetical protein